MEVQGTEYEIKSLLEPARISDLVESAAFNSPHRIVDQYLDTRENDLYLNAVFLRVRNASVLEVKHNEGIDSLAHLMSRDQAYPYPLTTIAKRELQAQIAHLLRRTNPTTEFSPESLAPFVTIAKTRREGHVGGVLVSLDEVDGLGTFVELEVRDEATLPELLCLADSLGLKNLPIGYVELYLRAHNFALYRRGRFVIPDDLA